MPQLTLSASELFTIHAILTKEFLPEDVNGVPPLNTNRAKIKLGLILSELEGKLQSIQKTISSITEKYKDKGTGEILEASLPLANEEVRQAIEGIAVDVNIPFFYSTDISSEIFTTAMAISLRKLFTLSDE